MENKEPSRDGNAEQEARSVEYKEEADQLLKSHGQEKVLTRDPAMLIRILGTHLLFVGTLAAVGALASSSNHKTTSEIFLLASVLLVLPVPIGVLWYFLRVRTPKKPTNNGEDSTSRLDTFMKSAIGKFLNRATNNPVARFVNLLVCITTVPTFVSSLGVGY